MFSEFAIAMLHSKTPGTNALMSKKPNLEGTSDYLLQGKHGVRIQRMEASLVEDTSSSLEDVLLDLHKDGDKESTAR